MFLNNNQIGNTIYRLSNKTCRGIFSGLILSWKKCLLSNDAQTQFNVVDCHDCIYFNFNRELIEKANSWLSVNRSYLLLSCESVTLPVQKGNICRQQSVHWLALNNGRDWVTILRYVQLCLTFGFIFNTLEFRKIGITLLFYILKLLSFKLPLMIQLI